MTSDERRRLVGVADGEEGAEEDLEVEGEGLLARAFCHELDHLDGHVYTEIAERMLSPEEIEEMAKAQEQEQEDPE